MSSQALAKALMKRILKARGGELVSLASGGKRKVKRRRAGELVTAGRRVHPSIKKLHRGKVKGKDGKIYGYYSNSKGGKKFLYKIGSAVSRARARKLCSLERRRGGVMARGMKKKKPMKRRAGVMARGMKRKRRVARM